MTNFTVSPEGTATSTQRGSDDPDYQRCGGCGSGFIVEEPDQGWAYHHCSHNNVPRPKPCSRCGGTGEVSLPAWDWWQTEECPECGAGP